MILPAQVTNVKTTVSKRKLTVTWKKAQNTEKYEVSFYRNNSATPTKTYDTKNLKLTFSSFPTGSYVVKVRAYNTIDGAKKYGEESTVRAFIIK